MRGGSSDHVHIADLVFLFFDNLRFLPLLQYINFNQYRLYCKGRILGHKRGKRNSRPNQSLVQIEGVDTAENARAYLGKVSYFVGWW